MQDITIINLLDVGGDGFHVHATGCADIKRRYQAIARENSWTVTDAADKAAVVDDVYHYQMRESDFEWEGYVGDFHFFPCVTLADGVDPRIAEAAAAELDDLKLVGAEPVLENVTDREGYVHAVTTNVAPDTAPTFTEGEQVRVKATANVRNEIKGEVVTITRGAAPAATGGNLYQVQHGAFGMFYTVRGENLEVIN
jgi:hypothetical protein